MTFSLAVAARNYLKPVQSDKFIWGHISAFLSVKIKDKFPA